MFRAVADMSSSGASWCWMTRVDSLATYAPTPMLRPVTNVSVKMSWYAADVVDAITADPCGWWGESRRLTE
jgi:hypothetical protein